MVQLQLSVVIPVHQEEALLEHAAIRFADHIQTRSLSWELILAENGSKDRTRAIAEKLVAADARFRLVTQDRPDYGNALRAGLRAARGEIVICEEIDITDTDFLDRALHVLATRPEISCVIGSKACPNAHDQRPWLRRAGTRTIAFLLRLAVGYSGTDTHGLKALRRKELLPIVNECVLSGDLFASEMVVRASRRGLGLVEIPLEVRERRLPTKGLLRRVPRALVSLVRLTRALGRNTHPQ